MGRSTVTETALIARLDELADLVVPFALRAICGLGVADHLSDGPRSVGDLAAALDVDGPLLERALRVLAAKGIFAETFPGVFRLTAMGECLRTEHPLTLRFAYPHLRADIEAWAYFDHCLRTGEAAFDRVHGKSYYEHLAAHPDDRARVDLSVQSVNPLVLRSILGAYDWSSVSRLVDLGGGLGGFLAGLLSRCPRMSGVLFDLPEVAAGAVSAIEAAGVANRCEIVAGDFFEAVPAGADTYLLKNILHDWKDDRVLRLLTVLRTAMTADSRLLVIEAIVPAGDIFDIGKLMDLHSLALAGGPERTVEEFAALFGRAGLSLRRALPTNNLLNILEVAVG